jgi:hypothetical protein
MSNEKKDIMEMIDIIKERFKGSYEELKEFPDIEYNEKHFIEQAKAILLELLYFQNRRLREEK